MKIIYSSKGPTREGVGSRFPVKKSAYPEIPWIISYFADPIFFSTSFRRIFCFCHFKQWRLSISQKDLIIVVLKNIWSSRKGYSDHYLCFIRYCHNHLSRHHAINSYFSRLPNRELENSGAVGVSHPVSRHSKIQCPEILSETVSNPASRERPAGPQVRTILPISVKYELCEVKIHYCYWSYFYWKVMHACNELFIFSIWTYFLQQNISSKISSNIFSMSFGSL